MSSSLDFKENKNTADSSSYTRKSWFLNDIDYSAQVKSRAEDKKWRVRFVDFGNVDEVNEAELYVLHNDVSYTWGGGGG